MFESVAPELVEPLDPAVWIPQSELPDLSPGLAECSPSPWLAADLSQATEIRSAMSDAELVDAAIGYERMAAWAAAGQSRILAEFARRRPPDNAEAAQRDNACAASLYAADEIGLALHLSRGVASGRIAHAARLDRCLTATWRLWQEGLLDAVKVRAVCDAVAHLTDAQAVAVEARVLPRAPDQTVGALRAALKRAVIAVDPEGAAARHRAAKEERRVVVNDEPDGMASLYALLSAPDAMACHEWLTRLARGLGRHDSRTMDARRADLLVDLLTGRLVTNPLVRAPGKPLVHVVMPYTTLTGADDQPCELVGYGPIPADLAREIAADAVWKRIVTDPLSGAVLDVGRTSYRPPQALADFVRARDLYCRSPICGQHARNCELDHNLAWSAHGVTADHNLWAGCPHDHHLKHAKGWTVNQHPDGRVEWITPTGHRYISEPHDYRPEPPAPPQPKPERLDDDPDEPPF